MIEIIIPVPVSHIKKHSILPDTTNCTNIRGELVKQYQLLLYTPCKAHSMSCYLATARNVSYKPFIIYSSVQLR